MDARDKPAHDGGGSGSSKDYTSIVRRVFGPTRASRRRRSATRRATQPAVGELFGRAICTKTVAAAAGLSGAGIVVDLDDEVVEGIVPPEPVAALCG